MLDGKTGHLLESVGRKKTLRLRNAIRTVGMMRITV